MAATHAADDPCADRHDRPRDAPGNEPSNDLVNPPGAELGNDSGAHPRNDTVSTAAHIHAPKVEIFDLDAMTNTDPKGVIRRVREYRVEPFGLYVARDVIDHPSIRAIESWLLPAVGLRATDWFFHPGHERDQDFYLDVVCIAVDGRRWRTEDHYLDLVLRTGRGVEVLDIDELLGAVVAGLLDQSAAQAALTTAYRAVDGLARHGYRLDHWLATVGAWPTWGRHCTAQVRPSERG